MALTLPFPRAHARDRSETPTRSEVGPVAGRRTLDDMYARIDEDLAER